MQGLVALYPSPDVFASRLDYFFNQSTTWFLGNAIPSPYYWGGTCIIVSQQHITAGYLSFHPMVQCVVHALKGLACRAPVLLALADVTKNIKYFSMGPKLRYLTTVFAVIIQCAVHTLVVSSVM